MGATSSARAKVILPYSQHDPCLYVMDSPIHGQGIFTLRDISAGEVLAVWGGIVLAESELAGHSKHSLVAIAEGLYLGEESDGSGSIDTYLNHSCDPNVWMLDEVMIAARRAIPAGSEIVIDQAMFLVPDEDWAFECHCGSPLCRGRVTGRDWRLPELQARYGRHFSPWICEKIRALRA